MPSSTGTSSTTPTTRSSSGGRTPVRRKPEHASSRTRVSNFGIMSTAFSSPRASSLRFSAISSEARRRRGHGSSGATGSPGLIGGIRGNHSFRSSAKNSDLMSAIVWAVVGPGDVDGGGAAIARDRTSTAIAAMTSPIPAMSNCDRVTARPPLARSFTFRRLRFTLPPSRMRIVHVITRLIIGGAQENTLLSCEGQHDRGHDVTLITGPALGPEGSLMERARAYGYRVVEVDEMRRSILPVKDFRTYRRLVKLLRELWPDVVHTHSSKAGIVGRWAADRAKVPVIVHTIHGLAFTASTSRMVNSAYRALERQTAPITTRIVCVADAMREQSLAANIGTR